MQTLVEANMERSGEDFNNEIKICENEASETQYWIEVIVKAVSQS